MSFTRKIVLISLLFLVAGSFSLFFIWPPITHVITGQTPEYPDLQPQAYSVSQIRAAYTILAIIDSFDDFTLLYSNVELTERENVEQIEINATYSTHFNKINDLHVWIEANGDGGSVVFMESIQYTGRSDWGSGGRAIHSIFDALNEQIRR